MSELRRITVEIVRDLNGQAYAGQGVTGTVRHCVEEARADAA
jgi:hypothetical protein